MADVEYKLRCLPLFYEDLEQKLRYIAEQLHYDKAASDLLDAVENAIMERLPIAEAFEPYHSVKERRHKYYWIHVKKFIIYYVVIDDKFNSSNVQQIVIGRWQELFKNTEYKPIDIHTPLWLWSRNGFKEVK